MTDYKVLFSFRGGPLDTQGEGYGFFSKTKFFQQIVQFVLTQARIQDSEGGVRTGI